MAGFLIVKYSIDTGLLSPAARVVAGLLFGAALIGGAETARRWHERVPDPRIAQALAGAGLSTLYASVLVAANLYGLISPGVAFVGLAAMTALAAGLSLRFGASSAVLGLLGGLAAPALVGSTSPNVPLLAAYLAFAVGGLSVLGRGRGWSWLAAGALIGGFGWGAALIAGGALDAAATLSVGVLLYGGAALMRLWRNGSSVEAAQILAISVALPLLPLLHLELSTVAATALALLGAGVSGGAAALGWRAESRAADVRFALLAGGSGALVVLAAELAWPHWTVAPIAALISAGLLWLSGRVDDRRVEWAAVGGAVLSLLLLLADERGLDEIAHATGEPLAVSPLAVVRWSAFAALVAFALWRAAGTSVRRAAALAIPPALGLALAPLLPVAALPLIPAALLALGAWWRPADGECRLVFASAAALALAWTFEPLAGWALSGGLALMGEPMLAADTPIPPTTLLRVILPVAAGAAVLRRLPLRPDLRRIGWGVVGAAAAIALHSLYSRAVGLDEANFAALGLWERTGWEALLAAGALAAWRLCQPHAALALGVLSLAHFAWFTGVLHNPLWTGQLAPLPALLVAYGFALALLWWSPKLVTSPIALRARDWALMALVLLLAASLLRWAFHGPLLSAPGVTPTEDVARSVGLIALAVAYLRTGLVQARIDWRLGSLVVMLAAVGKVFLVDAAGLDGLARIGAFAALGFSLLGAGWLYSRVLRTGPAQTTEPA